MDIKIQHNIWITIFFGGGGGGRPLGPKEIDGLLVAPGKACTLLTDYLIIG